MNKQIRIDKIESIIQDIILDKNLTEDEKTDSLKKIQNIIHPCIVAAEFSNIKKCPKCFRYFSKHQADIVKRIEDIPELKTKICRVYYICPKCGHEICKSQQPVAKKYKEGN